MMRLFIVFLFFLVQLPTSAIAQPMLFSRETLNIVTLRQPPVVKNKKKKEKSDKKEIADAGPITKRHPFVVEIHPLSATQFDWFLSREQLSLGRGILVVLDNKDELELSASNVNTPYDILFIQGTGKIQAIVPEVVLADLAEPLEITGRIRAVLYLRSGTAEALDIQPRDRVEHSLFSPAPKVLQ